MTILNRARSAAVAEVVVADTRARGAGAYRATMRRIFVSLVSGLLVIVGTGGLAPLARANNNSLVGSMSTSSSSGGRVVAVTNGARPTRLIVSLHQMHSHHGHHRHRDLLTNGFFPFGFGWPIGEPDVTATADDSDGIDWRHPPFSLRADRYEPPTVEKSPSGVTIVRGPGSHHGLSPY